MIFLSYDKGESKDMKKKNMIIIEVIALILVVAVGYALFSDTLNINGSATAKGDFSISATCTPGITNEGFLTANLINSEPIDSDNNYSGDSCSVNDNKVTYSAELLQPGATRNFTIKITNTGSIPAQLNLATGSHVTVESCIGNYDTNEFTDCDSNSVEPEEDMLYNKLVGFEKKDGTVVLANENSLEDIVEFFDENMENIVLDTGESMYLVSNAHWGNLGEAIEGNNKVLFKQTMTGEFTFTQQTNN